jgi:ABC-2 type transport system ATP-binding protein
VSRETGATHDGAALYAQAVVKSYGDVRALAGVDLEVRRGEVFALLGPNGAGKTTALEILEGYRRADGGDVRVLGLDPASERSALKPRIGIVLQSTGVDSYLTVSESIAMYSGYYPHPRPVDEVLHLVGLTDKRHARVVTLSGGQQRRLDVAIALAGDPELLFLDEPTTGFDPSARHEAWEVIRSLAALGKTVLLTTHYMDEAQNLADRVAVISGGRIVADGTPETLGGREALRPTIHFRLPSDVSLPPGLGDGVGPGGETTLVPDDVVAALHRLTSWALEEHVALEGLEVQRPTLEEVYLQLVDGAGPQQAQSLETTPTGVEPRHLRRAR